MARPETLRKLAAARNAAEQAGLYGTAGRLEKLGVELRSFHGLPRDRKKGRAAWASGKADEAGAALERELAPEMERETKDRRAGKDSGAILAKIGLCACTMFGGMLAVLSSESHRILAGAAFVIATLAGAFTIDRLIGPREPQEAADEIRKALAELKKALTVHMLGR